MLTTGPSQPPFERLLVLVYIMWELLHTLEALTCSPTSTGELGVKSWQVPPMMRVAVAPKSIIYCDLPSSVFAAPHQFHPTSRIGFATMSKPVDPEVIANFLAEQRDEAPADIQHLFLTFEDLWERKLWHQLTDRLLEFSSSPESKAQRLSIYNTFISSFADKINQLKLVKIAPACLPTMQGYVEGLDEYNVVADLDR